MTAAERYALVPFTRGGLLLDLESGVLFQLNGTATFIWNRFLDGDEADAIALAISERHGIDAARARADVATTLTPGAASSPPEPEDYLFRRTATGYMHLYRDRPELEIDATGTELVLLMPASARPRRVRNSLRALVPKILSLRGHTVFHASAVLAQGRLLAFSGRSGVGKTTTARVLAERGATLVSEDKLLVRPDGVAWRGAEPFIEAWVTQATQSLVAERRVSCAALDGAAHGEQVPIAEIAFLDIVARRGHQLVARRLDIQEATAASFRGMFLGTGRAAGWRRQLETAATFAASVEGYAVTMPDGLNALGRAADALSRRGTLAP